MPTRCVISLENPFSIKARARTLELRLSVCHVVRARERRRSSDMDAAKPGTVAYALRAAQVPPAVARGYQDATGIVRLRAWQRDVLEGPDGVAAGANAVVTVDTAGGKSCVAEVALLRGAFRGEGGVAPVSYTHLTLPTILLV